VLQILLTKTRTKKRSGSAAADEIVTAKEIAKIAAAAGTASAIKTGTMTSEQTGGAAEAEAETGGTGKCCRCFHDVSMLCSCLG
jgi:hypothetical protein